VNYSVYQEPDIGATETDVGGNAFFFGSLLHENIALLMHNHSITSRA
jgi:hypothetical protein